MNLICKHYKYEPYYDNGEIGGGLIKEEPSYNCYLIYNETEDLRECTYARNGKKQQDCPDFEKR